MSLTVRKGVSDGRRQEGLPALAMRMAGGVFCNHFFVILPRDWMDSYQP